MARKPRFFLSGVPMPVVQRGNNRQAICFEAVVGSLSHPPGCERFCSRASGGAYDREKERADPYM